MAKIGHEEWTPDYEPGTWITHPKFPDTICLVCHMHPDDGEYWTVGFGDKLDTEGTINAEGQWLPHEGCERADPPDYIGNFLGAAPEHVFVLLWLDETSNEQVITCADPESVLAHLPDALPAEAVANMQLKLMEAVADPGEWLGVCESPYATLCFQPVLGAER